MKTLILGIGNPILHDDAIGHKIIEHLQPHITTNPNIDLKTTQTGGLNLLDELIGYDTAILIDAIKKPQEPTGTIHRIPFTDLHYQAAANPHDVSLPQAIHLAQQLGETRIPKKIIIIGIVNNNPPQLSEHLSTEMTACIPQAVKTTLAELHNNT